VVFIQEVREDFFAHAEGCIAGAVFPRGSRQRKADLRQARETRIFGGFAHLGQYCQAFAAGTACGAPADSAAAKALSRTAGRRNPPNQSAVNAIKRDQAACAAAACAFPSGLAAPKFGASSKLAQNVGAKTPKAGLPR
jgi:hypothetical protein